MALHKRGGTWHYDFAVDGKRYRGTTKEKTSSRARMIESKLIYDVQQRKLIGRSRSVTLAKFSVQFLARVESSQQPLHDVVTIVLDTGMRPNEVFQMRWENMNWETEMIFIPKGKTKRSRRFLPMSARVIRILTARRDEASAEWVFPSSSASGHLTTVSNAGRTIARKEPLVQLTGISDK